MESHQRIAELLTETGAYKDLDLPVILTSGELGIYYVNTEKLVQDSGKFKEFGDNSQAMIQHAVRMTEAHPTFNEVIDTLTEKTLALFNGNKEGRSISGGQRRDWLFSGPVAKKLGLPHISLYKDGKVELVTPDGELDSSPSLKGLYDLHIVDLITEASSCYRKEDGKEKGWIPMIREGGATINSLIAVVTRLQGGEQRLAEQEVKVHPFVAINQDFASKHSKNPDRAIAYQENPTAWSEKYLRENGALAFVEAFDPAGGKLDRTTKFLQRYEAVLKESNHWTELDAEIRKRYNTQLK